MTVPRVAADSGNPGMSSPCTSPPRPSPSTWAANRTRHERLCMCPTSGDARHSFRQVICDCRKHASRQERLTSPARPASESEAGQAARLRRQGHNRRAWLNAIHVPRRWSLRGRVERGSEAHPAGVGFGRPALRGETQRSAPLVDTECSIRKNLVLSWRQKAVSGCPSNRAG
jgi:hypothetical protein